MPPYFSVNSGYSGYSPYPPNSNTSYPPYPQYPPYMPFSQSQPMPGSSTSGTTGTITDEHIRASLMSAVEDKLKRRLRDQFSQHQAELETLRRTHQELVQGKGKLDDILNRLEKEHVRKFL